jgi:hypothetical protein
MGRHQIKSTRWYITAAAVWFKQGHKDYYIHLDADAQVDRIKDNLYKMAQAEGYLEWRIIRAAIGNGIWILQY